MQSGRATFFINNKRNYHMEIKEVKITTATKSGEKKQVSVILGYCFATEISYKILAEEDIHDFIKEAIQCIQDNRMPDTRKSISLILAAMQAYYESIGKKAPLTDKDLMYHMTAAEMGTAVGTIIGLYMDANRTPQGEAEEKKEAEEADPKND
jgi:hypothetical protein